MPFIKLPISASRFFRNLLSNIAARITNRAYCIDNRIPVSYLIYEARRRIFMLIFGFLVFRKNGVLVSPSAIIHCRNLIRIHGTVSIDDFVLIDALSSDGVVLGTGVSIGKRCIIECTGTILSLGKGLILGNRVGIGSNSFLGCAGGIKIDDDTILGNYVSIHSESHHFSNPNIPIRDQGTSRKGVEIGSGCWIGAKATILDGVEIGNNCVVAAGAVVTAGCYPSHSVLAGVPAKIIKVIA
jgi:acetyltransferase-like isoleucine patch superfamily enzyme